MLYERNLSRLIVIGHYNLVMLSSSLLYYFLSKTRNGYFYKYVYIICFNFDYKVPRDPRTGQKPRDCKAPPPGEARLALQPREQPHRIAKTRRYKDQTWEETKNELKTWKTENVQTARRLGINFRKPINIASKVFKTLEKLYFSALVIIAQWPFNDFVLISFHLSYSIQLKFIRFWFKWSLKDLCVCYLISNLGQTWSHHSRIIVQDGCKHLFSFKLFSHCKGPKYIYA